MIDSMREKAVLDFLVDNMPAYVFVKDLEGNYRYINKALEKFFQLSRSDLEEINYTDSDLFSSRSDLDRILEVDRRVIESGEAMEVTHKVQRKAAEDVKTGCECKYDNVSVEEEELWFSTLKFPYKNIDGTIVGLCGLSRDITERARKEKVSKLDMSDLTQIEEALRQSEERHRTLFETTTQGVVYQDASGNIISVNPSAERILGLTLDQMMGRTSVDPRWKSVREDGSDYPGESHPSMSALKTGQAVTNAIMGVYHPADETQHWISIDAIPLFKPNEDKPFQVYTTFTDITQQKNVERNMLCAKEKAEEADKLKSAFLANMSHEIRTPLNGIMGHIDIALSNKLSPEYRLENIEGLEVARESGYLLVSIINDILDLSKIEAGQMAIGSQPFSLRNMLDQTMKVGHILIKSRKKENISLTLRVDDKISKCISGDNFRIQQIINNLVSNAVKFTESGSVRLEVVLSEDETMLQFNVHDTGRGIPEDQLEVIFEAFRQVDFSDTRKFGGTGLGLTISRKLLEMMSGKLWVHSKVGEFSSFYFTIPYAPAPDTSVADLEHVKEKVAQMTCISSGKILIAEDDPVSRKIATRMVENAGYDVVLAENGHVAVSKFEADPTIDLILMDVNMDIMGGLEATSLIRSIEAKYQYERRVPIIALSAAAMNGDRERGAACGMTAYLTKPVNRILLIEAIEQYVGKIENGAKKGSTQMKTRRI
jgi:PAS domain S-box-containing protein